MMNTVELPAFASLLPFLLLIIACARLDVPDPSSVFGLGLLLVVLAMLPSAVGLLIVGPWLGFSSWHAYRCAVRVTEARPT